EGDGDVHTRAEIDAQAVALAAVLIPAEHGVDGLPAGGVTSEDMADSGGAVGLGHQAVDERLDNHGGACAVFGAEGASNVFEGHGLGLDGDVVDLAEGGVDGVEGALSLV